MAQSLVYESELTRKRLQADTKPHMFAPVLTYKKRIVYSWQIGGMVVARRNLMNCLLRPGRDPHRVLRRAVL